MAAGRCKPGAYHRGSLCSERPWTVCLSAHACSRPGRWMALLLLLCRQKAMVARAKARTASKRVLRRSGSAVPKPAYEVSVWDWGLGLDGTISHTVVVAAAAAASIDSTITTTTTTTTTAADSSPPTRPVRGQFHGRSCDRGRALLHRDGKDGPHALKRRAVVLPQADRRGRWPSMLKTAMGCASPSASFWSPSRRTGGWRRAPSPQSRLAAGGNLSRPPVSTFACFSPPPVSPAARTQGGGQRGFVPIMRGLYLH